MRRTLPLFFLAGPLFSQTAPAPANSQPVQLSVFEVSADKDVGYQAGNTTSGSRLNASLKDTAAAVMVFTPEFLSDFSVNTLADMVAYAPNMAVDMLDTAADANPQFSSSTSPTSPTRTNSCRSPTTPTAAATSASSSTSHANSASPRE